MGPFRGVCPAQQEARHPSQALLRPDGREGGPGRKAAGGVSSGFKTATGTRQGVLSRRGKPGGQRPCGTRREGLGWPRRGRDGGQATEAFGETPWTARGLVPLTISHSPGGKGRPSEHPKSHSTSFTAHMPVERRLRGAHPHPEAPPGRGLQRPEMPDRQAHPWWCSRLGSPACSFTALCVCACV